jgi:hypothetical protein
MGRGLCCLMVLLCCRDAGAWGRRAHEDVNRLTVEHLSPAAAAVFGPLKDALVAQAMEPDDRVRLNRAERHRHFLDLEALGLPPPDVTKPAPRPETATAVLQALAARSLDATVQRDVVSTGSLIGAVDETFHALVAALRARHTPDITRFAVDLLHYVADAHQPLHATLHYDGLFPAQNGVHRAFEEDLINRCPDSHPRMPTKRATALELPILAAAALLESHALASTVLAVDLGCPGVCRKVPAQRASGGTMACGSLQQLARTRLELAAARAVFLLERAVRQAAPP